METNNSELLEVVNNFLSYNPVTGIFTWKRDAGRARRGDIAGSIYKDKYINICLARKNYRSHRLAWLLHTGEIPEHQIDHIDGNGMNNAITNLRHVTNQENQKNRRLCSRNKSGAVGVYYIPSCDKWRAYICVDSKWEYLGIFREFEQACAARKNAQILHGYHENHGSIRPL